MKVNMRKVMPFIVCVVMVSCSTTTYEPDTLQTHIEFGTAVSRSAINSADDMNSFSVWGGYGGENCAFNGVTVERGGGSWTYGGGNRYWVPDKVYSFYAVHPSVLPDGTGVTVSQSEAAISVEGYDCSAIGSAATDLMTASCFSIDGSNPPSIVDLHFLHELTRLNFVVKSENIVATVSGFKVYGVNYKGDMVKKNGGSSVWTPVTCTPYDTPYVIKEPFTFNSTNGWEKDMLGDMLLIPDAGLPDAKLEISYRYQGETDDRTSVVDLKTESTPMWEAGHGYKYTMTINGSSLSIKVTVNPWEEEDTSVSWEN